MSTKLISILVGLALVLPAAVQADDPVAKVYRSRYHLCELSKDNYGGVFTFAFDEICETNYLYARFTRRAQFIGPDNHTVMTWVTQDHYWGKEIYGLYYARTNFAYARTNYTDGSYSEAYKWVVGTDLPLLWPPHQDSGRYYYVDPTTTNKVWRRADTTFIATHDITETNQPELYTFKVEYLPVDYRPGWHPAKIYNHYKVLPYEFPAFITPKAYNFMDEWCVSPWIHSPIPEYIRATEHMGWVPPVGDPDIGRCYSYRGEPISYKAAPLANTNSVIYPANSVTNALTIQFDLSSPQLAAAPPQPPGEPGPGCTNCPSTNIRAEDWVKRIAFVASPGGSYAAMYSSNLVDWFPADYADESSPGQFIVTDRLPSSGFRFYQIVPVD